MLTLNEITAIPEGLLELSSPTELHTVLPQPTLLHLDGRRKDPLFVSVLLHGNEDTGFYAIQELLKKYQSIELPRSISIFFGNVSAAKDGLRRLDGQPDYNRVWPGGDAEPCPETALMTQLTGVMAERKPFASIDVHNNTGLNPHYGCINSLDNSYVYLASLFARTVVFFLNPKGVQSMAMAEYCPSITIECGKSNMQQGVDHALEYLDAVLNLAEFPEHPVAPCDVDIFHTVARITVPKDCSFSFTEEDVDIKLATKIEAYNFSELSIGTAMACVMKESTAEGVPMLEAWNDQQENRSKDFFQLNGTRIELAQELMPAMITLDERVIRQDCLCYLMERISA